MIKDRIVDKIIKTESSANSVFEDKGRIYTFLNPVSYLDALGHKDVYNALDGIFADGALLVAAIRLCYGIKVGRFSFDMTSLAPKLLEYACKENKSVYIVASAQDQVERAVEIFKDQAGSGIRHK